MKRFFTAAVLGVLLCTQSGFLMQSRGGEICWRENGTAVWHNTGTPSAALANEADRLALERGLALADGEALTRALEDYCS